MWTTCERVVGRGADNRNRWTRRARVALRLGLLLAVHCGRPSDAYETLETVHERKTGFRGGTVRLATGAAPM